MKTGSTRFALAVVFLAALGIFSLFQVANGATPSILHPGQSIPEVDDTGWGTNLRGWMLSTDEFLHNQRHNGSFGTATFTGKVSSGTLEVTGAAALAGSAEVNAAGYGVLLSSHTAIYIDTQIGIRRTPMAAGSYTTMRGWRKVDDSSPSTYAYATTGIFSRIIIGANGGGLYRVHVQVAGTNTLSTANNIEGCVFKNGAELGNCQDLRSYSTSADIGRLGAFGYVRLVAGDTLSFQVKPSSAASFRPRRGNFIVERIAP
jgi:hypothetical protein